jgi:hypothetical protein
MRSASALRRATFTSVVLGLIVGALGSMASVAESQVVPLNPFMCYELRRQPRFPGVAGVALANLFVNDMASLSTRKRLCNPAVIVVPVVRGDLLPREHLVVYQLRQTDPPFTPIEGVQVDNQFGTIVVDLVRPDRLMVPTAKTPAVEMMERGPTPPASELDHYECYRVRGGRTRVSGIEVTDQFGKLTADIKRPDRLCVPVDKNGEGITDATDDLMCYRVRTVPRRLLAGVPFFIENQFEEETVIITGPRELCVPSTITLPGGPTPTPMPTPEACHLDNQDVCGGFCQSTEDVCLFDDGECRCVSASQGCALQPPFTANQIGMCEGLCPGKFDFCFPGKGDCQCFPD